MPPATLLGPLTFLNKIKFAVNIISTLEYEVRTLLHLYAICRQILKLLLVGAKCSTQNVTSLYDRATKNLRIVWKILREGNLTRTLGITKPEC
jgi:hypothetical protein